MVIVTRFVWMYPAIYLPRWLVPAIRRRDPSPPWQWAFALSFTGVRGVVSLAAALAIPFATDAGAPFPSRDLILFLTFSVILVTLVGQGLTLPLVVRWLGLANAGRREHAAVREEEFAARRQAVEGALERLEQLTTERDLPDDVVRPLRLQHRERIKQVERRGSHERKHQDLVDTADETERLMIAAERQVINKLYRGGKLKDEARRRIERQLDLREAHIANLRDEA